CWDLIDSHTTQVIRSESFLHLSHAQLGDIVRRSTLCVEEIDLYERVVQWARTQLERAREEPTPAAIRGVLGDVLFSIRFPLMGAADFSHEVAKSAILTAEEVVEVFLWRTIRDKPTSFSCEPRGVQQSAAILNGSASPSPQAIDDPTTIPDNYLENGDWCARGLFVTVRPVYEYAGLLYLEGVILSAA
ncbi:BTB (POZ) domain containing 3, partial [Aphelenchoides avenae]